MLVKIINSSQPRYWYHDKIGMIYEVYNAVNEIPYSDNFEDIKDDFIDHFIVVSKSHDKDSILYLINKKDAEIIIKPKIKAKKIGTDLYEISMEDACWISKVLDISVPFTFGQINNDTQTVYIVKETINDLSEIWKSKIKNQEINETF